MKWYLLERNKELTFANAELSNLRGYKNKVKGYETWNVVKSCKTEKALMEWFEKEYLK